MIGRYPTDNYAINGGSATRDLRERRPKYQEVKTQAFPGSPTLAAAASRKGFIDPFCSLQNTAEIPAKLKRIIKRNSKLVNCMILIFLIKDSIFLIFNLLCSFSFVVLRSPFCTRLFVNEWLFYLDTRWVLACFMHHTVWIVSDSYLRCRVIL